MIVLRVETQGPTASGVTVASLYRTHANSYRLPVFSQPQRPQRSQQNVELTSNTSVKGSVSHGEFGNEVMSGSSIAGQTATLKLERGSNINDLQVRTLR